MSAKPKLVEESAYNFLGYNALILETVIGRIDKRLQDHDDHEDVRVFTRSLKLQIATVDENLRKAMENCTIPKGDGA